MPIGAADFITQPSWGGLVLLQYLLFITMLIHFGFICMLMGGSTLSLVFNLLDKDSPNAKFRRLAHELMDKLTGNVWTGIIFGLLPMVTTIFLLWQLLYDIQIANMLRWWVAFGLLTLSLIFLYTYKNTFAVRDKWFVLHFSSGLWGLLLLFGAYLMFVANKSFLLYPELWRAIKDPSLLAFASNYLLVFLYFVATAFAVTGGAILFLIVRPLSQPSQQSGDEEYRSLAYHTGLYVALIFTLVQPLISFIELIVLPEHAISTALITGRIVSLVLGMLVSVVVFLALAKGQTLYTCLSKWAVLLVAGCLTMMIVNDFTSRNTVLKEQLVFLQIQAQEAMLLHSGNISEAGRQIYENNCRACHSIDGTPLLGPSFKGIFGRKEIVLSNGQEREITVDEAYLVKSLKEPAGDLVKSFKNLMPPQDRLSEQQIKGLVEYLKTVK